MKKCVLAAMLSVCVLALVCAGCSDDNATGNPDPDGDVSADGDDSNDDIEITEEDITDQDLDSTEADGDSDPVDNTEDTDDIDNVDDVDDLDTTEGDAPQEAEPEIENEAEIEAEAEVEAEVEPEVEVEPEEELEPCDGCRIAGACFDADAPNPDNPCEICVPANDDSAWTPAVDMACDDEDDCSAGDACDATGHCVGTAYTCNDHGSCNADDDICTCDGLFGGDYCDGCIPGYYNYPTCEQVICDIDTCNDNGSCADGICTCQYGYGDQFCDACDENFEGYPDCVITCGTGLENIQRLTMAVSMKGVAVKGDYVFTGSGSNVVVVDISSLPASNATVVATKTLTNSVFDLAVQGDYLYVAANSDGLAILDISDPTTPGDPVYLDSLGQLYGISIDGDYCALRTLHSFHIVDISSPLVPVLKSTVPQSRTGGVYLQGSTLYTLFNNSTSETAGLAIYDITDPTTPGTPAISNTPYASNNFGADIDVVDGFAYIAHGLGGVAIIDVSDPTNPGAAQFIPTTYETESIIKYRDTIFVGTYNRGYHVIDISDLANPVGADTNIGLGGIYHLAMQGGYLFGVTSSASMRELQINKITCD